MAVVDLNALQQALPEIFAPHALPPNWNEDWIVVSIDDLESAEDELWDITGEAAVRLDWSAPDPHVRVDVRTSFPSALSGSYPGAPQQAQEQYYPPRCPGVLSPIPVLFPRLVGSLFNR